MKIIFSPSKGMDNSVIKNSLNSELPLFIEKANYLRNIISELSVEDFEKKFKLKGKLLQEAYNIAINKENEIEKEALLFYSGVSFRQLELEKYSKDDFSYVKNHVFILSALYGVLNALDRIKAYRLDMGIKILDESLYSFWKKEIDNFFKEEDLIINLASNEFSKMLDRKKQPRIIDVEFRQLIDGNLKNISTEAKKARGLFLNYMIKNKIVDDIKLKEFNLEGYIFSEENSESNKLIFIKK